MTNNDLLQRLRYILNFNDQKMLEIFSLAKSDATIEKVSSWLNPKTDCDREQEICPDLQLSAFLNGLIIKMRGEKEGTRIENESKLNNNMIFNKLKIAFNLKAEEIIQILELVDFTFSKHELSALFRKSGHKHYRECKDQVLRNFLGGIQIRFKNGMGVNSF